MAIFKTQEFQDGKDGVKQAINSGYSAKDVFSYLDKVDPDLSQDLRKEFVLTNGFSDNKIWAKVKSKAAQVAGVGAGGQQAVGNLLGGTLELAGQAKGSGFLERWGQNVQGVSQEASQGLKERFAGNNAFLQADFDQGFGAGKTVNTIGAAVYGGQAARAATGASRATMVPKFLTGSTRFAAGSLAETSAATLASRGERPSIGEAAAGLTFDGVLGTIGWLRGLKVGAGESAQTLLKNAGEAAGLDPAQIQVITKPENVADFFKLTEISQAKSTDAALPSSFKFLGTDAFDKFTKFKASRSSVGKELGDFYKGSKAIVDTVPVKQSLSDMLTQPGINIIPEKVNGVMALTKKSFADSAISNVTDQNALRFLYDKVSQLPASQNIDSMWRLQKSLNNFISGQKASEAFKITDAGEAPFIDVKNSMRTVMNQAEPALANLNTKYHEMTNVFTFLNRKFGPKGAKSEQLIKNALNVGSDTRTRAFLSELYKDSSKNITDLIQISKLTDTLAKPKSGKSSLTDVAVGTAAKTLGLPDARTMIINQLVKSTMKASPNITQEAAKRVIMPIIRNMIKVGALS